MEDTANHNSVFSVVPSTETLLLLHNIGTEDLLGITHRSNRYSNPHNFYGKLEWQYEEEHPSQLEHAALV